MSQPLSFHLPNVGAGPDALTMDALAAEADAVVLALQRDYRCPKCQQQAESLADRYPEFRERGAEVVSVLPNAVERAEGWQDEYDLPYPLLADYDANVGEALDQPRRFGFVGRLHDFIGRMPETVVLDTRDGEPTVHEAFKGSSPGDRPAVDDLLAAVDEVVDDRPRDVDPDVPLVTEGPVAGEEIPHSPSPDR